MRFHSRRSPILSSRGIAATSQPLASDAALRVLRAGGNAADAAVAAAASLNVLEPCMTGVGGDAFCLFYDAASRTVRGLNGSGRSPAALDLQAAQAAARAEGGESQPLALPADSVHCVTVPGAAAAWCDTLALFGSGMPLADVLQPSIELAEGGFAVAPVSALSWRELEFQLTRWAKKGFEHPGVAAFLPGGRAPEDGQWVTNPDLAATFRLLAEKGKAGYYSGRVAQAIVTTVQRMGGKLSLDDLARHSSDEVRPLSITYGDRVVWELPPNGQGLVALLCLAILKEKEGELRALEHNSSGYLHLLAEALRLAFAQGAEAIADPAALAASIGVEWDRAGGGEAGRTRALWDAMLSPSHVAALAAKIDTARAMDDAAAPLPTNCASETVYLCVVDGQGNACSFINSNYAGFGTGIVPDGCGFTLQNRGANFSLVEGHPNALGPSKRPYHTIIPGLMTRKDGAFDCAFGVMGGFMQPQGHVQVVLNMLLHGMDPQAALDAPRLLLEPAPPVHAMNATPASTRGSVLVFLEDGISAAEADELAAKGHTIRAAHIHPAEVVGAARRRFGKGQIIQTRWSTDGAGRPKAILWAGSDPRGDGCAMGW